MSTIDSKKDATHIVSDPTKLLVPTVDNSVPVSLTPAQLKIPERDENDNIIAEVSLRKETLANLLAIIDAGDGEIAVATDVDALVVYQGSPSVGLVYWRNDENRAEYFNSSSLEIIATGELQFLSIAGPGGAGANGWEMPTLSNAGNLLNFEITGVLNITSAPAGTIITLDAYQRLISPVIDLAILDIPLTFEVPANGSFQLPFIVNDTLPLSPELTSSLLLGVQHDDAGNVSMAKNEMRMRWFEVQT